MSKSFNGAKPKGIGGLTRRDFSKLAAGATIGVATGSSIVGRAAMAAGPDAVETPVYIAGHYRPVKAETTANALNVQGAIPPTLSGLYLRNGHNPKPGVTPPYWFAGSGMVHGVRLGDGKAAWYRNRWVDTPALHGAPLFSAKGKLDLKASIAGTSVIAHGGRIMALQEQNLPFELATDLTTVGAYDFSGALTTMMTAHPKIDPVSGEMLFFGSSAVEPHLTFHLADRDGALVHSEIVPGAGPGLMHDFAITENYILWFDPSVTPDFKAGLAFPFPWNPSYQARIGIMPRDRRKGAVKWIAVPSFMMLHFASAYESADGTIVAEGSFYDERAWGETLRWANSAAGHCVWPAKGTRHARWQINLVKGTASLAPLDDLSTEFQTIDPAHVSRANRYTYATAFPDGGLKSHALVRFDSATGKRDMYALKDGQMPSEAFFVADGPHAGDGEGWLLTYVSDLASDGAELWIMDATRLAAGPVACIEIPVRVPSGVHGTWVPDSSATSPI